MDFDALLYADFSKLNTAVGDWSDMVGRLKDLEEEAKSDLKAKALKADWSGSNADVTREFIEKTTGEFADAHTQATSIRNILRDTRDELVEYRRQLKEAIERGTAKNLTVRGTGDGGFTVTVNVHPDRAAEDTGVPERSSQDATDLRDEIRGILKKARNSDTTAAKVLRALVDQSDYGFSDGYYKDRDSAAEAIRTAEKMAKIVRKGDPSLEELASLDHSLEKYADDPLFADRFASRSGGKETLQFWSNVTSTHAGARGDDLEMLKSLQENMSITLATATQSDSLGMQRWEKEVMREGNTAFRGDPMKGLTGPLGLQVMSSLMGHGSFDSKFLDEYGKLVWEKDRSTALGPGHTKEVWENHGYFDLVFGKGDGQDPVNGFMNALSHNPDAAESFFKDKERTEHMLESTKNTDRGTPVSRALEAAVTGVPHGGEVPAEPIPHSRDQVEIVKDVMHVIAKPGGEKLVDEATGESLGHIAAAYMPEINRAIAGGGAETVFMTNSEAPNELSQSDAYRFLYNLAKDDDAYASVIYGQNIYTSSSIEAHIANPDFYDGTTKDAIGTIAKNSGIIEGVMANSRQDIEIGNSVERDEKTNKAFEQQGEFFKTVVSTATAVGAAALVPQTLAGQVAAAAASSFFAGTAAIRIDHIYEGRQMDGTDEAIYRSSQGFFNAEESGTKSIQDAAGHALEKHDSDLPPNDMKNFIRKEFKDGWVNSDSLLESSTKRPSP
ncbi:DUF6571 family protein [Streptomyces barkulensis]|uniref:DUF6571 family protein n=1 Tax=Streptomyces barkulensis TaxID=1257026 RepID=UPI000C6D97A3|nr:DUF6571 family protein [Streptomyces barkulensis]